ncbi:MAG: DUF2147 domain-containing protein [Terracidiphilus sp.]
MFSRAAVHFCAFVCLSPFLAAGCFSQAASESASTSTPVGRWKSVDDKSGKPKSELILWLKDGKLYGRIETILDPAPDNPNHKCIHCSGAMKDRELLGMEILWDMKPDRDAWSGGFIFDPDNGSTYRCIMELQDGGKKLKVRGYIGFSLFGRTQYWYREE